LLDGEPLLEGGERDANVLLPHPDGRQFSAPGQLVGVGARDREEGGYLGDGEQAIFLGMGRGALNVPRQQPGEKE
jgi:hypothetical protein